MSNNLTSKTLGVRRPHLSTTLMAALVLTTAAAQAQAPAGLPPPAPYNTAQAAAPLAPSSPAAGPATGGKIVLPERTEVRMRLNEDLKSGANKEGEEVPFSVASDVYGPGHVLLIPAGASAYGKVTKSSRRNFFGKPGKLAFTCEYVLAADGTHVPLRSNPLEQEGSSNAGAALGIAVFVNPLFLLMNGKDVTVHKGEEFTVYVNENTPLTPPFNAAAPAATPAISKSLFTLKSGEQVVGVMTSFDGTTYIVAADKGARKITAANIKSIYSLK